MPTAPPDCILLDSTGELQNWYAVATIVFVGKSLTAHGGQNPVEPILAGKPVLFGPHMENFSTLAQALIANNAAVQIQDPNSLEEKSPGFCAIVKRHYGLSRTLMPFWPDTAAPPAGRRFW